jgi:hypothetical protein
MNIASLRDFPTDCFAGSINFWFLNLGLAPQALC